MKIPRDAYQQIEIGQNIDLSNSEPGDLAFFENKSGKITHVGIILENEKIIHASGHVRIDKLDKNGIFNLEKQKYSHKLHSIKKLI